MIDLYRLFKTIYKQKGIQINEPLFYIIKKFFSDSSNDHDVRNHHRHHGCNHRHGCYFHEVLIR